MVNCEKCGKKIRFLCEDIFRPKAGGKIVLCNNCYHIIVREENEMENKLLEGRKKKIDEENRKKLEEMIAKAPKIKCPYCEQWFPKLTQEQYRVSAELNTLKWFIIPAWGLAGSLKNRPYVECPHCKMKIMQG